MLIESEDMFSVSYSFSGEETLESSKQSQVLDFIYQILRKRCEAGNYTKFLQDGSIIEELMVRACPTPLGKKMKNKYPKNPTPQQRVEKIINDMFEYGVSLENLFDPNDLIEAKDIPKVTDALMEISKIVYTGQGRSRLKTAGDLARASFRCSECNEKFARSNALRDHMNQVHPGKISDSLKKILEKYGGIEN